MCLFFLLGIGCGLDDEPDAHFLAIAAWVACPFIAEMGRRLQMRFNFALKLAWENQVLAQKYAQANQELARLSRTDDLTGDSCLQTIARTLQGAVREDCDLLARFGGEEFTLIMTGAGLAAVSGTAERIRTAVQTLAIAPPGLRPGYTRPEPGKPGRRSRHGALCGQESGTQPGAGRARLSVTGLTRDKDPARTPGLP